VCLAVAIRYSLARTQFGQAPIMAYRTHQRRLLPGLAAVYAMQVGGASSGGARQGRAQL